MCPLITPHYVFIIPEDRVVSPSVGCRSPQSRSPLIAFSLRAFSPRTTAAPSVTSGCHIDFRLPDCTDSEWMKLMQQSKGKFHCENVQGLFELPWSHFFHPSKKTKAKNATLSTRSRWEGPHQPNLGASPSLAQMEREPGAWWTGAALFGRLWNLQTANSQEDVNYAPPLFWICRVNDNLAQRQPTAMMHWVHDNH